MILHQQFSSAALEVLMLMWNDTFIQIGHFELILQNIRFRCIWITFPRKCHAENSNIIIFPHISDGINFHHFKILHETEILFQKLFTKFLALFHCVNQVTTTISNNRSKTNSIFLLIFQMWQVNAYQWELEVLRTCLISKHKPLSPMISEYPN